MRQLVVVDISLSLDGYMRGANPRPDNVLGDGGGQLHAWARELATEADRTLLAESLRSTGAVICGRRTYDDALPGWRADGPTGPARLPTFVVTHATPGACADGGVYRFAHGIDAALDQARAAADGKHVCIMGGADVAQQFLRAGLVDELSLHIVPAILGGGTRMFDNGLRLGLAVRSVIASPGATHVRYALAHEKPGR